MLIYIISCTILIYICNLAQTEEFIDFEVTNEEFKTEVHTEKAENLMQSVLLGKDISSGCLCRQYIVQKYVTCYDPIGCKKFPRSVRFRTKYLRISTTAITVLSKGDLRRNVNLTTFRLEGNTHFNRIEPGAFDGMVNLVNLSISHNENLSYLESNAFRGLTNLKYLNINKNGFLNLKDFTPSLNPRTLPALKKLVISQMLFPKINEDDFADLNNSMIESLNIYTCKIEHIHPKSINPFKKLRVLGLGENYLTPETIVELIIEITNRNISLDHLSLANLGLRELPIEVLKVIGNTNITHLSLSKNRFEVIESFPSMPKIERIDLIDVIALNMEDNAFSLLPNIKTLHINKNPFSDIPKAALLPHLTVLDISYSGGYFSLQDNVFTKMTHLARLNLSGNNIRKLSNQSFIGLTNLKVLGLKGSSIYYIENETFVPLKNLVFLDLRENLFASRDLTGSIFDGLQNLEVLLLGKCLMDSIDPSIELFDNLKNLKHLGLEKNKLRSLDKRLFEPLSNLETLDISSNAFISWNAPMFLNNKKLVNLMAYDNKIRNITHTMIEDFVNLQHLNLQKNPFSCTCDDMSALTTILFRKRYVVIFNLLHHLQLNCTFPESYTNQTILDYFNHIYEEEVCKIEYVLIPLLIIVVITLFIIICIIYFYYRWDIRYYIFLIKLLINNQCKRQKSDDKNKHYEYDAFVSYSNEDRNFVERMVTVLENSEPFFKLCVYERDFQIGTIISESVAESIVKSKKTLLIVSQSYIKSHWCRWEVQMVENHRLFGDDYGRYSTDSLVIIKLGEISLQNLNPVLKYLLKTRIYLEWEENTGQENAFWDKLKQSLIFRDRL